jgi:AAHS family 4-hydroxybenzoate transporter-like MFS transporter
MPPSRQVDVQEFIDTRRLSALQIATLAVCFLIVAVDGFDTAAIGFIAPAIRAEWSLSPARLAPLFAAGLVGLMAGSLLIGPLADRYGRKRVLLGCVVFFGLASLASAASGSLGALLGLRFLTGLGLGGAMPNAVTLCSEFAPARRRSALVTAMFCGFTLGSAFGGLAAAQLLAEFGWRSVLVAGGVLPLALAPAVAALLPESVRFLVARGAPAASVMRVLGRIAPGEDLSGVQFVAGEAAQNRAAVWRLFDAQLLRGTCLLWLVFFMSLLVIYLLSSWLPTLIHGTGMSLAEAARVTAAFQIGGTVGALALGVAMDRFPPHVVLGAAYVLAAGFTAAIGHGVGHVGLLVAAVFGAGFCVSGAQVGANALAASFYPTAVRATGVSWACGIGRIGSVVGSLAGAGMLALDWSLPTVFALVGAPALVAGASVFSMRPGAQRVASRDATRRPVGAEAIRRRSA